MQVKPRANFFAALAKAKESASSSSREIDSALKKADASEGLTYSEFHACCELIQAHDEDWSVSEDMGADSVVFQVSCEGQEIKCYHSSTELVSTSQPPVIPERNPELEARVQRLKKEQDNRAYRNMVKNVDHNLLKNPCETLGAQVKEARAQVTNVVQLILTVVGTFVFAYKLVDYNVEGATMMDKVAVGLSTALIVGLCDFYFVMRQMCEDDKRLKL
ncbi:unnamed protein product [Notodromas monacha]|uniref:Transmembrane protein 199 n=1 Tax=Notodromas monacha TaxID=399045 RepID=A0A7R9BHD3_9CRUS|nr:unnamed protein product [Notodromas monacha]CAG0913946.1 unnamed protein product [Notodromas monacha]